MQTTDCSEMQSAVRFELLDHIQVCVLIHIYCVLSSCCTVVNQTVDLNAIIGTLISAVNVTSYQHWITGHKHHHSHSNNMDRKQLSQSAPWQAGFTERSSRSKRLMANQGTRQKQVMMLPQLLSQFWRNRLNITLQKIM